jgi:hypothetical protein
MKTMMRVLGLVLFSAAPAAAVSETVGLSESLAIQVIHGGPACSSGSVLVAGVCQAEGTMPVSPPPAPFLIDAVSTTAVNPEAPAGDPSTPTPEPATLLPVGTGLALAAGARAVRRWTRATFGGPVTELLR